MRRSFGCLSIPAMLSAFITLLVIAGSIYMQGGALFSAGALNAEPGEELLGGVSSHHEIGGQCKSCHTAPWEAGTMADRCVVCHTQISAELNLGNGLHGNFLQTQNTSAQNLAAVSFNTGNTSLKCIECHPEHRGMQAALVEMDLADFPHENLNFSLRSHPQKIDGNLFACADCHEGKYEDIFSASSCVNCHYTMEAEFTQTHALEFGMDCLNCHDGLETFGSNFDHNLFPFQLTGQHAQAVCADCHHSARSITELQSTDQKCFSCHQEDDHHQGLFGTNCAVCHTVEAWNPAKIDHNLSKFPLEGLHVDVACEKCHANQVFAGTPQNCFACHQDDDRHNGQLGVSCEACHTVAGWDQVKVDHSLFAFPLTGAHVNVNCESCHQNGAYKGTPQDCKSCHQNDEPHEGRFGADCVSCHTTDVWKPAKFDHNLADFKLTGSHVSVACEACHSAGSAYRGTPKECYACHRNDDKHNGAFGTDCTACHNTSTWKGTVFDHNLTAFKLTGAHGSLACTNCHQNGTFKGTPQDCNSCHRDDDKHNGQFGTNCASCHSTSTWQGATFDHNLAAFKLTGLHVNVACANCHQNGVYKGTPQDCNSCHRSDDKHNGQFGTNCASCHSTSTWKGATFDHNLSAFKLTGAHGSVSCTNCHQNGTFKGTPQDCYSCHRNNDKHNGQFGTNCASCHSTSTWRGATFNHNLSGFPLTGRHVNLACERCHKGGQFSGTPSACVSCHSDPAFHAGMFGTNCASCHSTSNWSASYRGSHPGIADEGGSGVNHGHTSCRTCHTSNLRSAMCTACHDGNENNDSNDDD